LIIWERERKEMLRQDAKAGKQMSDLLHIAGLSLARSRRCSLSTVREKAWSAGMNSHSEDPVVVVFDYHADLLKELVPFSPF
jgi:hypothetical protein